MPLSFSVFNKFKAVDETTTPMRKIEKSFNRFGDTATREFRKADRAADGFNKKLKTVAKGIGLAAGVGGILALKVGVESVTRQFIEFDDAIIAAGARFKDIGPDVDNFSQRIQGIKDAARSAGAATEFTAAESAKALDFLARAGFNSVEAIGSLVSMINLATASGEEFAAVADYSSDLLGSFGLNTNDSMQKIKNLNRLNDRLIFGVNSANVTIESLFETMKQVGPVATRILNSSLEEVISMAAVLGSSGIKGTEGMTALKNIFLRLAAPTPEAAKVLDALNVSIVDIIESGGTMKNVLEIIGQRAEGLSKLKRAEVFDVLFGKRAIAGATILMEASEEIDIFNKKLLESSGIAQRTADLMRTSLGNRLKALGSSAVEFGFKLIEGFEIRGKNGIEALTNSIREIDTKPITDMLEKMYNLTVLVASTTKSVYEFVTANKTLLHFLGKLSVLYVTIKTALLALNSVIAIWNLLLSANPIGIVIVAMGSLALAIDQVIKNWDYLKQDFALGAKFIEDHIENAMQKIFGFLKPIDDMIGRIFGAIGGRIAGAIGLQVPEREKRFGEPNIGPNTGMISTMNETVNRSSVDVNINNLPPGTEVKQNGEAPGFNLVTAYSGGA